MFNVNYCLKIGNIITRKFIGSFDDREEAYRACSAIDKSRANIIAWYEITPKGYSAGLTT